MRWVKKVLWRTLAVFAGITVYALLCGALYPWDKGGGNLFVGGLTLAAYVYVTYKVCSFLMGCLDEFVASINRAGWSDERKRELEQYQQGRKSQGN